MERQHKCVGSEDRDDESQQCRPAALHHYVHEGAADAPSRFGGLGSDPEFLQNIRSINNLVIFHDYICNIGHRPDESVR